ncbi:GNAT family N-acetyltransferase [Puniceibacterium sp. IMCC21224]|uniref:GNAT family N-acetyltransferase n=1 Tax=Puniceibacterium sp. IMCC21224 TaxID=1618204 RepID=UPI00065D6167|nr:GNAT family N-acetyltransferase [Puniceibacterium sp. IMCC21224]KMK65722.1 Acetyltransferase (GNAT) domain [Puniceibacterium sp. IMCC21224]
MRCLAMREGAQITVMTLLDLAQVLDWAAAEGWNPGLDDADAFLAADPAGFLVRKVDETPVAAISVVNHDPDFAFLGLYLCAPEWRGQGHGLAIWQAGLVHADGRTVGLDGVPAQESNYVRSGFVRTGGTARFVGLLTGAIAKATGSDVPGAVAPDQIPALLAREWVLTGMARERYLTNWFAETPTRRTRVLCRHGAVAGYGTVRRCRDGVKVGPFWAIDSAAAEALLADLAAVFGVTEYIFDLPDSATDFREMLAARGFVSTFDTARMYLGPAPVAAPAMFQAVTTLELS